ncbi:MAG: HAMP domain-containing sensor histidine kinase [Flavobacteriaceae bacterium]|nr:HAMP domain-containing sensor histidine kinase [Flavobacteriaceae bacterium]
MQTSVFDWKSRFRRAILVLLTATVVFILWSLFQLVKQTEIDERHRMEVWALAQKQFVKDINLNDDVDPLIFEVLTSENSIPMIVVDEHDNIVSYNNIDPQRALLKDSLLLKNTLKDLKKQNDPIEIVFENAVNQRMYYGQSTILEKLKLYPSALLLLLLTISGLVFFYLRTSQIALQNKLWTGMAKETAHQLGTPLSSLMGWVSMLKTKGIEDTITTPMEADLKRLETITNRFSKIGSLPVKKNTDIVHASRDVFDYLAGKASKGIAFTFYSSTDEIHLKINKELYCWVVENLLNNAIDAVVGKGKIELSLLEEKDRILINVIDTGKGIPKRLVKRIFQPGVTTKKRGWGLGLSLCRRIIEDYHQGSIQVRTSSKDKGTHFEIVLHK